MKYVKNVISLQKATLSVPYARGKPVIWQHGLQESARNWKSSQNPSSKMLYLRVNEAAILQVSEAQTYQRTIGREQSHHAKYGIEGGPQLLPVVCQSFITEGRNLLDNDLTHRRPEDL